jgi:TRAP-type mannitol/chloroaromatic compound transport system substrate-binding protein
MTELEVKNAEYLKILRDEGVDIRPFPAEVIRMLKQITQEVIAEMAANDVKSAKVYQAFKSFKEMNKPWSDLTEKVFYNEIS